MKTLKRILIWIFVLIASILLHFNLEAIVKFFGLSQIANTVVIGQIFKIIQWAAIFILLHILINSIIWDKIISKRFNKAVPDLIKFISSFLLFVIFVAVITTDVFGKSLTSFLAFSGGLGLLIGFALQHSVVDFFSGIVIHLERPFVIGDFIMLNNTRLAEEPLIGKVVSIDWRTSRLQKTDGTMIIVPNNQFTRLVLTNFSLPEEQSRIELEYCIGYEVDTERAIDIILTALYSVDTILKHPRPKVKIPRTTLNGVIYQVRFWVMPSQTSPGRGRDNVNRAVINYLRFAGISLAYDKLDIHYESLTDRKKILKDIKRSLISKIPIFSNLSKTSLDYLYENMTMSNFNKGSKIVTQDQENESMYIISEGFVSAHIFDEEKNKNVVVGKIGPGQFFGEMSLVLGATRTATIIAEKDCKLVKVDQEIMKELFEREPELLSHIVEVIDRRKRKNNRALQPEMIPSEELTKSDLRNILSNFFKVFD